MLARSESRDGYRVRVLAVHTTEGMMRAADLKAWKSWAGSSHASADETGALLTPDDGFVPYSLASWTLRSGNRWSENIELCGFAKWKRGDWLAHPKLLDAAARWLADRSQARGIPLVKLSPTEYAAGRSGVIGHNDHTVGYSDGTHWDPGPGFPWDVVLAKANAYAAGPAVETLEEVMADVASLKFVTSPVNTNAWWLTDGMTKRLMVAGEPEMLMQLGLAEKHRPETGETVAVISDDMLRRIPTIPAA